MQFQHCPISFPSLEGYHKGKDPMDPLIPVILFILFVFLVPLCRFIFSVGSLSERRYAYKRNDGSVAATVPGTGDSGGAYYSGSSMFGGGDAGSTWGGGDGGGGGGGE